MNLSIKKIHLCLYPLFEADKAASNKRYSPFSEMEDHHTITNDSHNIEQKVETFCLYSAETEIFYEMFNGMNETTPQHVT